MCIKKYFIISSILILIFSVGFIEAVGMDFTAIINPENTDYEISNLTAKHKKGDQTSSLYYIEYFKLHKDGTTWTDKLYFYDEGWTYSANGLPAKLSNLNVQEYPKGVYATAVLEEDGETYTTTYRLYKEGILNLINKSGKDMLYSSNDKKDVYKADLDFGLRAYQRTIGTDNNYYPYYHPEGFLWGNGSNGRPWYYQRNPAVSALPIATTYDYFEKNLKYYDSAGGAETASWSKTTLDNASKQFFANTITITVLKPIKKQVKVRHIDIDTGEIIPPNMSNTYEMQGYGDNQYDKKVISKSIDNKEYEYYAEYTTKGETEGAALAEFGKYSKNLNNVSKNINAPKTVVISYNDAGKYTIVTYMYKKNTVSSSVNNDSSMDLSKGKVSYSSDNNFAFANAIPPNFSLNPGIVDVDKYYFGGIKYVKNSGIVSHTSGNYQYSIPYSYYDIANVTYYTLSKAEIYDSASQTGGTLGAIPNCTYTKTPSTPIINYISLNTTSGNIDNKNLTCANDSLTIFGNTFLNSSKKELTLNGDSIIGSLDTEAPDTTIYSKISSNKPKMMIGEYNNNVNKIYIPPVRINGLRKLTGKIYYTKINLGGDNFTDSITNQAVSSRTLDTSISNSDDVVVLAPITSNYRYTPPATSEIIDHRIDKTRLIAQRGSYITLEPTAMSVTAENVEGDEVVGSTRVRSNSKYGVKNANFIDENYNNYVDRYAIKFSFIMDSVQILNASGGVVSSKGTIAANTWIEVPKGNKVKGLISNSNTDLMLRANQFTIATLANNRVNNNVFNFTNPSYHWTTLISDITKANRISNQSNLVSNPYGYTSRSEAPYIVYETYKMDTVGRVFDLRITDVTDIDWKNIFRNPLTNVHTGNAYYAGSLYWNTATKNDMASREINSQMMLPIGPRSNTNNSYIKAPKLGYRFSFDIRTSGALSNIDNDDNQRKLRISPSYYYISKDGKTVVDNVDLYYQDSSNRYVKVGTANDKYNMYMKPNDGVRLLLGSNSSKNFSSNVINIVSPSKTSTLQGIELTKYNMTSDGAFIQNWYGEFKLPNTTVAVMPGEKDIKKKLTNGYIGIRFNIVTIENSNNNGYLSYDVQDGNGMTEWDYENYKKIIPLENGTLDLDMYPSLKGTVFMYDTDTKASTDYDVGGIR